MIPDPRRCFWIATLLTALISAAHAGPRVRSADTYDLNGDGKGDLVAVGATSVRVQLMNGTSVLATAFVGAAGHAPVAVADFDGDGKDDLLLEGPAAYRIDFMDGITRTGRIFIPRSGGTFCAAGDYGSPPFLVGNGGGDFSVAGGADVDGDGDEDVFLDGPSTRIDRLGGTSASAPVYLNSGHGWWAVAALGDFDGDGKPDFASRSAATIRVLLLDGTAPREIGFLPSGNGIFALRRADDLDGDSRSDLVSQSTANGLIRIDLMNGVASATRGFVAGSGFAVFP